MDILDRLFLAMVDYYAGDPRRIQHFTKVHSYARLIGTMENLDARTMEILEAAAYVHDIGIKPAEAKYGECGGRLQEQEGPPQARAMLSALGFDAGATERICYLVAHHHSYSAMDGMDYRILVEADFLVNLHEDKCAKSAIAHALRHIFTTESGKRLCRAFFAVEQQSAPSLPREQKITG